MKNSLANEHTTWKLVSKFLVKWNHRWLVKFYPSIGCGWWTLKGRALSHKTPRSLTELVDAHFLRHSAPDHICRPTLTKALNLLQCRPAVILETGSSAWGTNSSLLFDAYVTTFGGTFETVDIRVRPSVELEPLCSLRTTLYCNDSINFLKNWSLRNPGKKIDLLYLDSWDVDWANPNPSALHGLAELLEVLPHLHAGSLLLIDDTPVDTAAFKLAQTSQADFEDYVAKQGFAPGKGALCRLLLKSLGRGSEVMHRYQSLWQFWWVRDRARIELACQIAMEKKK